MQGTEESCQGLVFQMCQGFEAVGCGYVSLCGGGRGGAGCGGVGGGGGGRGAGGEARCEAQVSQPHLPQLLGVGRVGRLVGMLTLLLGLQEAQVG